MSTTYLTTMQILRGEEATLANGMFGTCNTYSRTEEKIVTLAAFDGPEPGVQINIRFLNGCRQQTGASLKIGSTDAIPVEGPCICNANEVLSFVYEQVDSTHAYWRVVGHYILPSDNTPQKIGEAVAGTSSEYSRADHVHSIDLDEGDANGQVKIGGKNVSVKGLGSAAYTNSSDYATAEQGQKADDAMPKSGGTFTGKVKSSSPPTEATDLATKGYVDSLIEGGTGNYDTVGSASGWNAGSTPSLGEPIHADDITNWEAGTLPQLGDAIDADEITNWDAGTVPTLEDITADEITAWDAGSVTSMRIENGILKITTGAIPTLGKTQKTIHHVTNVGSVPTLGHQSKSIPNITSVGTLPQLSYEDHTIPNVENVGTVPTLTITDKDVLIP